MNLKFEVSELISSPKFNAITRLKSSIFAKNILRVFDTLP